MKTIFKKGIALVLFTSALASQLFAAKTDIKPQVQIAEPQVEPDTARSQLQRLKEFLKPANLKEQLAELLGLEPKTSSAEKLAEEKTTLQKAANISGAFARGFARGLLSGIPNALLDAGDMDKDLKKMVYYGGNMDALVDLFFDCGQIDALSETLVGKLDMNDSAAIVEEVTAALVHAAPVFIVRLALGKFKHAKLRSRKPCFLDFCTVFINRLIKNLPALDTRKAEDTKKWCLLAAHGIAESINTNSLICSKSPKEFFTHAFRPLVGVAAVGRIMLIDSILNKREAAGVLTNAQDIQRTRTILNAFIGLPISIIANIVNRKLFKAMKNFASEWNSSYDFEF